MELYNLKNLRIGEKMEIEYLKKEKNEIEFIVKEEDSAIFDLIIDSAQNNKDVEFVSKKKAEHLMKEFVVYLRTKNKSAKDVLLDCINDAENKFIKIINDLQKNTKNL